jgi:hypothetical protein
MTITPKRKISDRSLQIARLRREYDAAFRELIVESRRCRTRSSAASAELCAGMEAAAAAVRQQRDKIAAVLLSEPEAPPGDHRVQEAAYFRWLNAGRPSGTAMSDWFAAQQQILQTRHSHAY